MVQSIGICMILAVTTLTGAYFCLREKYRLQDLRELERASVRAFVRSAGKYQLPDRWAGGDAHGGNGKSHGGANRRDSRTDLGSGLDAAYIPYLFVGRRLSKYFALWQNIGVFGSGTAEKQYRAVFDGIAAEMRTD